LREGSIQENLLPQIMSEKKVKVVKRAELGKRSAVKTKSASETARTTARDMVNTVTTWVSEFETRQRVETATAVENLIRSRQQPNEA
jgi:uncharacterized membrane-anchored protein